MTGGQMAPTTLLEQKTATTPLGRRAKYEGYPLKHYVFQGNTSDPTTVQEVVKDLKQDYHIEEMVFVGDRGMISKLNLKAIEGQNLTISWGSKYARMPCVRCCFPRSK